VKYETLAGRGELGEGIVPELELREAANEGAKLIGSSGGEGRAVVNLGIDLRGKEADEEVEDVNAEGVGDDVEALDQVHAENIDGSHHQTPDPTAEDMRRRFVQHVLILPRHCKFPP